MEGNKTTIRDPESNEEKDFWYATRARKRAKLHNARIRSPASRPRRLALLRFCLGFRAATGHTTRAVRLLTTCSFSRQLVERSWRTHTMGSTRRSSLMDRLVQERVTRSRASRQTTRVCYSSAVKRSSSARWKMTRRATRQPFTFRTLRSTTSS